MRKEAKEIVVRTETVWIAEDETEFKSEYQCKRYEFEKFKKPLLDKLQKAVKAEGYANFGTDYTSEDNSYNWYKMNSQEDIEILEKVYEEQGLGLKISVGDWVCVEETCDDVYFSTLEGGMKYVIYLLDALGYDIEIKEMGETEDGTQGTAD